jgi:hypothetical protein
MDAMDRPVVTLLHFEGYRSLRTPMDEIKTPVIVRFLKMFK